MTPPVLDYGDELSRRGITCRTTAEGIHVIIPNLGGVARLVHVPPWLRPLLFAVEVIVNLPVVVVGLIGGSFLWVRLFRSRPAVEVEVTRDEVIVTDRREGELVPVTHRWPRHQIAEVRPNRYAESLWVRIPGREVTMILQALDRPALEYIARQVVPLLPNGDSAE